MAETTFAKYCAAHPDMDSKSFGKLCKDTGLLDKKFTANDCDLLFLKAATKGQRRITIDQFFTALELVAERKGVDSAEVISKVAESGGPVLSGTKADAVRFHDDKSTYTGVHQHGGPDAAAKGEGHLPSGQASRVGDLNFREDHVVHATTRSAPDPAPAPTSTAPASKSRAAPKASTAPADVVARTVKDVFKAYCGSAPDMEGKSFTKLLKDIGAIDGKKVTPTDSDLIFAKAVTKGQRRLNFAQFETALQYVADKKGVDVVGIRDLVENSGGPKLAGTTPEAVRFHDDKSTYTGVHQHGGPDSGATGTGTATQLASAGMGVTQ